MSLRVGDVSHFGREFQSIESDYEFYKKAKIENTVEAYQKYLKVYPDAEFKKSAERAIKQLKKQ